MASVCLEHSEPQQPLLRVLLGCRQANLKGAGKLSRIPSQTRHGRKVW